MSDSEGPDWDKLWRERPVVSTIFTVLKFAVFLSFITTFVAIIFDWYVPTRSTPVHLAVLLIFGVLLGMLAIVVLGLFVPELGVVPPSRRKLTIGIVALALMLLGWVSFGYVLVPFTSTNLTSVDVVKGVPVDLEFTPPEGEAVYVLFVVSPEGDGYDHESPYARQCKHAEMQATSTDSGGDTITRNIRVYMTGWSRRHSRGCTISRVRAGELRIVDSAKDGMYRLHVEQVSGTAALTQVHLRSRPAWLFWSNTRTLA